MIKGYLPPGLNVYRDYTRNKHVVTIHSVYEEFITAVNSKVSLRNGTKTIRFI